jgi:hypothetical protein
MVSLTQLPTQLPQAVQLQLPKKIAQAAQQTTLD